MDMKRPKTMRFLAIVLKVRARPSWSERGPIKNPPSKRPQVKVYFMLKEENIIGLGGTKTNLEGSGRERSLSSRGGITKTGLTSCLFRIYWTGISWVSACSTFSLF